MKKITIFVAAAMCAISLTACGSDNTLTQYEQEKVSYAVDYAANDILPIMDSFSNGTMDGYEANMGVAIPWNEYTMEEVANVTKSLFQIEVDGYGFYNARTSFMNTAKEIGAIVEVKVDEATAKIDGSQIVVSLPVKCLAGDATAEVILSNDQFMVLESASLTRNFTMKEKMSKAGLNTAIGIGTVFVVLILISLLISLLGLIPKIQKAMADSKAKKDAAKNAAVKGIDNAVNQIIENETAESFTDDTELVAVIAAAIAAYEGAGSTDGYVVRSIRRR